MFYNCNSYVAFNYLVLQMYAAVSTTLLCIIIHKFAFTYQLERDSVTR